MVQSSPPLRKTPLNAWHRANGGQMVASDGWEMPGSFGDAAAEHVAVRERAGLFDLSHTGWLEMAGADALAALQWLTCNDASGLHTGQVQHSALTTSAGTCLDGVLVYRLAQRHFLLGVSPANLRTDVNCILSEARRFADVAVVDTSSRYSTLSLQGPAAREILQALTGADLRAVPELGFAFGEVAGARATISAIARCGEQGFDVLVPPQVAPKAWAAILSEGADLGAVPAGLDALETLRLEAGWRRSGADLDEATTMLEADLESIVAWDKGEFQGRAVLVAQKSSGLTRRLVGFEMVDRAVALRGHEVFVGGSRAGTVTSGAYAPFLAKAIGMTYLPVAHAANGTGFEIDVGGRRAVARVVPLPFYSRPAR
jgi:aminomethyltransferase